MMISFLEIKYKFENTQLSLCHINTTLLVHVSQMNFNHKPSFPVCEPFLINVTAVKAIQK